MPVVLRGFEISFYWLVRNLYSIKNMTLYKLIELTNINFMLFMFIALIQAKIVFLFLLAEISYLRVLLYVIGSGVCCFHVAYCCDFSSSFVHFLLDISFMIFLWQPNVYVIGLRILLCVIFGMLKFVGFLAQSYSKEIPLEDFDYEIEQLVAELFVYLSQESANHSWVWLIYFFMPYSSIFSTVPLSVISSDTFSSLLKELKHVKASINPPTYSGFKLFAPLLEYKDTHAGKLLKIEPGFFNNIFDKRAAAYLLENPQAFVPFRKIESQKISFDLYNFCRHTIGQELSVIEPAKNSDTIPIFYRQEHHEFPVDLLMTSFIINIKEELKIVTVPEIYARIKFVDKNNNNFKLPMITVTKLLNHYVAFDFFVKSENLDLKEIYISDPVREKFLEKGKFLGDVTVAFNDSDRLAILEAKRYYNIEESKPLGLKSRLERAFEQYSEFKPQVKEKQKVHIFINNLSGDIEKETFNNIISACPLKNAHGGYVDIRLIEKP